MRGFKTHLLASTVLAILAGASPALAQDAPASPDAASANAERGGIADIVVTARKRQESAQRVPVAITAFSPETLKDKQIVTLADISQNTSGLTLQQGEGPQRLAVTIRGQNTLDSTLNLDPAIGLYIDGVYNGPDIGNAISLNFDDAASVEVLKGPQGTLYGRNTSGGAIKLDHALPEYATSGWVTGELGGYDLHGIKGVLNVPIVEDVAALRVYGRYSARDGFGRNDYQGVDVNDDRLYSFAAALRLDPAPNLNIIIRGNYDNDRVSGQAIQPVAIADGLNLATLSVALTNGLPVNADGTLPQATIDAARSLFFSQGPKGFYDAASRFPNDSRLELYNGSITVNYDISDALQLKSITAYRHLHTYRGIDYSGTLPGSGIVVEEPLTNKQFTEELTLSGEAAQGKLRYTLGAFYMSARGRDTSRAATDPVIGDLVNPASAIYDPALYGALQGLGLALPTGLNIQDGIQKTKSYAIYGQATYEVAPGLNVTGGLRWTKEDKDLTSHNQFWVGTYNPTNGFVTPYPLVLNQTVFCSLPQQGIGDDCSSFQPYTFKKVTWLGSVDYRITPDIMVYAKVSRGFRSGGGQLRLGGIGAPPVGPETVDDYEIGIKADLFDRRARVNIAVFQDEYSGLQKTFLLVVNGAINSVVQNAGKARIRGAEFDFLVEPTDGLTLGLSGAYTDPKYLEYIDPVSGIDLSGQKFQGVAKFVYTASLDYKIPTSWGKVSANLSYWHTSSVPLQPGAGLAGFVGGTNENPWATQKAYGLLNGRVSTDIGDHATIGLWAKNIAKEKYFTYNLDLTASLGYAVSWGNTPRTWGVDATYRF